MFYNLIVTGMIVCAGGGLICGCQAQPGRSAFAGGSTANADVVRVADHRGESITSAAAEPPDQAVAASTSGAGTTSRSIERIDDQTRFAAQRQRTHDSNVREIQIVNDPISKSDIAAWAQRGLPDAEIIDRIERSGAVFDLTAADETALRDSGVSSTVIRALRNTARR